MKIRILSRLVFRLFFVAFTMLRAYPVQKSSRLDGSKLFSKMKVSKVLGDNSFYIFFLAAQASNFHGPAITMLWAYSVQK